MRPNFQKFNNKISKRQQLRSRRRGRRGRRSRRGSRRAGAKMHYVEIIPISIKVGTTASLTVSMLSNRPKKCGFRVQYVHFVGTAGYDVGTSNVPGNFCPSAIEVTLGNTILSADGKTFAFAPIVTSGPVVLGVQPRNVKVFQPRTQDWFEWDVADSSTFAQISAACLAKAGEPEAFVRGIVHVLVAFGTEFVDVGCPSLQEWVNNTMVTGKPTEADESFSETSYEEILSQ